MDIEKYNAGKAKGLSSVTLHGDSTLLISWPDGFNPSDGSPNPPKEQGFQMADLTAMRQAAQDAHDKTAANLAMHDALLADAAVFQSKIDANLQQAKAKAESEALAAATDKALKP